MALLGRKVERAMCFSTTRAGRYGAGGDRQFGVGESPRGYRLLLTGEPFDACNSDQNTLFVERRGDCLASLFSCPPKKLPPRRTRVAKVGRLPRRSPIARTAVPAARVKAGSAPPTSARCYSSTAKYIEFYILDDCAIPDPRLRLYRRAQSRGYHGRTAHAGVVRKSRRHRGSALDERGDDRQ